MDVRLSHAALVSCEQVSRAPLHIAGGHLSAAAAAGNYGLDLRDHLIFPGLINAHDHLHVNGIPPLRTQLPFPNSYAWITAFQPHFADSDVVAALAVPKALRHRHGGLKNLLCGATSVAHHDPWNAALDEPDFPVNLLRNYGWSYALAGPAYGPPAAQSFAATPVHQPWMIHLAEGTDAMAAAELAQLQELGCLGSNTVIVHGVGLSETDVDRVIAAGAAVVWCPGSNLKLLGRTLDPRRLFAAARLALGSDSRLSGTRDLLQELKICTASCDLTAKQLLRLVTADAARILRMPLAGGLQPGQRADLVIVADRGADAHGCLFQIERSDIRAVVCSGVPAIADPDFSPWFAACGIDTLPVRLDGKPKLLAKAFAQPELIALEPGLEVVH